MYSENETLKPYYDELEPEKRRELFEELTAEAEDDGANAFRRELFAKRHTDPKDETKEVDRFLWHIIILPSYQRSASFLSFITRKEIRSMLSALLLENAEQFTGEERSAAYWEYRNAAKRYISTCNGPQYAKKAFGLIESTDEEKLAKTAEDFYKMTVVVPRTFNLVGEMQILTDALRDEFLAVSPEAAEAYRRLVKEK